MMLPDLSNYKLPPCLMPDPPQFLYPVLFPEGRDSAPMTPVPCIAGANEEPQ